MNFSAWQDAIKTDPARAARLFLDRAHALPSEQQQAIWAWLPDADTLTAAMAAGMDLPGGGLPAVGKDLFHVAGLPTRAGGNLPAAVTPARPTSGQLVRDLTTAGIALAGKTHLHEFAYGLTGENPHHGNVVHPRHPDRTSGGSSSGSAAAVAAGICPLAFGTDTGGSIRVPAAFCGLHGLRLTPGHPWISDAFALAPGFDTPGWFTANATDMRRCVDWFLNPAVPGRAPRGVWLDATSLGPPCDEPELAAAQANAARRWAEPAPPEVAAAFSHAHAAGAMTYAVQQSTEAYAVHQAWLDEYRSCYGPAVWALIDRGRRWSEDQRADATRRQAAIKRFWAQFFLSFDFCVLPATPFTALPHAACNAENRQRLLAIQAPASLAGLPVLTLPVPLPGDLSTGLQIIVNSPRSPVLRWVLDACVNDARRH